MNVRSRIARLDKAIPRMLSDNVFHQFRGINHMGWPIVEARRDMVRRLRDAIADPRASEPQRAVWQAYAEEIEAAIESESQYHGH